MPSGVRAAVCCGLAALITTLPPTLSRGADVSVHFVSKTSIALFEIKGDIKAGDEEIFGEKVDEAWRQGYLPYGVRTYSNGGDLGAAMAIGKIVRRLLLRTEAPYSILQDEHICGMTTGDSRLVTRFNRTWGTGDPDCNCLSACFFVWSAGVKRGGNVLGIHRPYYNKERFSSLTASEAESNYGSLTQEIEKYLLEMNVPHRLIEDMIGTSSSSVTYVEAQTLELMRTAPFYEELKIARCGSLTHAESERSKTELFRLLKGERQTAFDREILDKKQATATCERALRREHIESVLGRN